MDRVRRGLLSYGVIVAEYLLAAGVIVAIVRVQESAPTPASRGCIDSCFGTGLLMLAAVILAGIALTVGLVAALITFARRGSDPRRRPGPGFGQVIAASRTAILGLLWGILAAVVVVVVFCGVQVVQPLVRGFRSG